MDDVKMMENVTDYSFIRAEINALASVYNIVEIATDPWNATSLTNDLQSDGFRVVNFRQMFSSMAAPTRELERLILSGNFIHFNDPVLVAMLRNTVVVRDAAGNIRPDKEKSAMKIDGVAATISAMGLMLAAPTPSPLLGGGGLLVA